jgi:hypothetical protein
MIFSDAIVLNLFHSQNLRVIKLALQNMIPATEKHVMVHAGIRVIFGAVGQELQHVRYVFLDNTHLFSNFFFFINIFTHWECIPIHRYTGTFSLD